MAPLRLRTLDINLRSSTSSSCKVLNVQSLLREAFCFFFNREWKWPPRRPGLCFCQERYSRSVILWTWLVLTQFMLQQQTWVVARKSILPTKLETFTPSPALYRNGLPSPALISLDTVLWSAGSFYGRTHFLSPSLSTWKSCLWSLWGPAQTTLHLYLFSTSLIFCWDNDTISI